MDWTKRILLFNKQLNDTTYTIHIVKGTILSGKITEDTTLTADNYYIIKNSLLIPKGVTVNVEPGTKIQFWASDQYSAYGDNYIANISVKGNMHFNGTEGQPIELFPGKGFEQYCVNVKKSDSGTVDMNYVNITNPTIDINSGSHLNCVQNMDMVYDRHFSSNGNVDIDEKGAIINAEYLEKSKISNFRPASFSTGAIVVGNMDTVLFDNCNMRREFGAYDFIGNVKSSINCTYLVNEVTYGTRGWASTLINPGEYFRTPDCSVVSNIYNVNGKKYVAYKFDNYFYRENNVDGYDTKAFDNYLTLEKVLEKNNAHLAMLNLNDTDEKNILNKVFNDILGEGSSKDLELAGGYYYDEDNDKILDVKGEETSNVERYRFSKDSRIGTYRIYNSAVTCYGVRDLRKYVLVEFPEETKDSVINNPNKYRSIKKYSI